MMGLVESGLSSLLLLPSFRRRRINLPVWFLEVFSRESFYLLDITLSHIAIVERLPYRIRFFHTELFSPITHNHLDNTGTGSADICEHERCRIPLNLLGSGMHSATPHLRYTSGKITPRYE